MAGGNLKAQGPIHKEKDLKDRIYAGGRVFCDIRKCKALFAKQPARPSSRGWGAICIVDPRSSVHSRTHAKGGDAQPACGGAERGARRSSPDLERLAMYRSAGKLYVELRT
jgi:hypothetical protein